MSHHQGLPFDDLSRVLGARSLSGNFYFPQFSIPSPSPEWGQSGGGEGPEDSGSSVLWPQGGPGQAGACWGAKLGWLGCRPGTRTQVPFSHSATAKLTRALS